MSKYTLIYCYDSYCGWCYGFSNVITQIANDYKNLFYVEVLSGGMILPQQPVHISATASYIQNAYKRVQELSGVTFGQDYLWHIQNPDKSDWFPNSEKPAIALCIIKDIMPNVQIQFMADLQYALHFEGRDLTDNEAYKHLLAKYLINEKDFYTKLHSTEYKEKAYYEFALCKQLHVKGYPCLLLQASDTKFYLIANGYSSYQNVKTTIDTVWAEIIQNN